MHRLPVREDPLEWLSSRDFSWVRRTKRGVWLGILAIFTIISYLYIHSSASGNSSIFSLSSSKHGKYAYCTFLDVAEEGQRHHKDPYFLGVRMLIYQLLHDPATRTTSSIPFVVLVSGDILPEQRQRLELDGALVLDSPEINFDWIKPDRARWSNVMGKLNVFKLTQYDKILLLDSDVVVIKPLDAIFSEPSTDIQFNLNSTDTNLTREDEGPQPSRYLLASQNEEAKPGYINAGFVVLRPSLEMYEHYVRVAAIPDRFDSRYPEQNLWNYVHRQNGNMPWRAIDEHWTINGPTMGHVKKGLATLHAKWWKYGKDEKVRELLYKSRYKMEGFWGEPI